jgi:serine protease Do
MKIWSIASGVARALAILLAVAGLGVLVFVTFVAVPTLHGQRADGPGSLRSPGTGDRHGRELTVLAGRGAEIGVSIRDVESSDRAAGSPGDGKAAGGVIVEEVRPDGPADKAGLKRSDLIVEFDGERVRSARQFSRLVQETPPDRAVKATIVRDGQRRDAQIAPSEGRDGLFFNGEELRSHLGDLGRFSDQLPFNFNFDLGPFGMTDSRGRLGVTVEALTPQLGSYFGAKDGALVTTVTEDSPAARAGLKAGDVITTLNGEHVRSRDDLVRALGDVKDGGDVTIGIVRDKRESTVTAKLDSRRPSRHGRPA